jgi:hypothetical protein
MGTLTWGGYDVIDLANAMKLLTAYRVFITRNPDDKKVLELTKYASEEYAALAGYDLYFVSDEITLQLRKIDATREDALIEYVRISSLKKINPINEALQHLETGSSFLRYCLEIGAFDANYWGKIYNRIGITWETSNEKDRIYILIKHHVNFIPRSNN